MKIPVFFHPPCSLTFSNVWLTVFWIMLSLTSEIRALIDVDGDGMSDIWTIVYSAEGLPPGGDTDGDGLTNLRESIAGTDPRLPSSLLTVYETWIENSQVHLRWPGHLGKDYILQSCRESTMQNWVPEGATIPGGAGPLTVSVPLITDGFALYRIAVFDRDSDQDGASDWEERQVGYDPYRPASFNGQQDGPALSAAIQAPSLVSLETLDAIASEAGLDKAHFILHRSGGIKPLTVHLSISGAATPSDDYTSLAATVYFGLGQRQADLWITPLPDDLTEDDETVEVAIAQRPEYDLGAVIQATASIHDPRQKLFLAALRPAADPNSPAYGYGALRLAADRASASLSLSWSCLRSWSSGATLHLSAPAEGDPILANLPDGQTVETVWTIAPAAGRTIPEIADAIDQGLVFIRIDSDLNPTGELSGTLLSATGARSMPIPPDPPALSPDPPDQTAAARFLTQATMGPDAESIAEVRTLGYSAWIDAQAALPPSSHLAYIDNLLAIDPATPIYQNQRQEAWWLTSLTAPDQLRQRMAFALSQIMVVSDRSSALTNESIGLAVYYDLLVTHALGNFRDLLEAVTLNPAMGRYLTHLKNSKPDPARNLFPDENYAREVMQLFTIGLYQLHPDGTLRLDDNGLPIPSYGQDEVTAMAHVFTGWNWHNPDGKKSWNYGASDYRNPMSLYPSYHDTNPKRILNGLILPGGRSGTEDLRDGLDALFQHPNTGPFIALRLIQRLVTSNPSPGYVYRVAQVFADNGQGQRGDLLAVARAILLDYEARQGVLATGRVAGLQREPLLRMTQLYRAFHASAASGIYRYWNPESGLFQAALRAPSVFNFFEPFYQHPGPIAGHGLLSPEFQIASESTIITVANTLYSNVYRDPSAGDLNRIVLDLTAEKALTTNPDALLDRLEWLLRGGPLSTVARGAVTQAITRLTNANPDTQARDRARLAVYLVLTAPETVIFQ